jgi:uncharacterized membrane protein YczE
MKTTTKLAVGVRRTRRPTELMLRRVIQLLVGLFLYGAGIAFLIRSALGASPWDVLAQGIFHHVPLTFGTITVILSGVVLLLWIPLRQKPGIGTVLNSVMVGPSVDISFVFVPEVSAIWLRILFVGLGIVVIGMATGLYIGSRFGPGPRDGLMTALHRVTCQPIWKVRVAIESVVVTIGWILGGTVGIGTIAFAVLIGYVCQYSMRIFSISLPSDSEPTIGATIEESQAAPRVHESPA